MAKNNLSEKESFRRVGLTIPKSLAEKIEAYAEKEHRYFTNAIISILAKYFENEEKNG